MFDQVEFFEAVDDANIFLLTLLIDAGLCKVSFHGAVSLANILTCHSRMSTGVAIINNCSVLFKCPSVTVDQNVQYQEP